MAVPKKRTSCSRKRWRHNHSALEKSLPHVVKDKATGQLAPRHNILPDGTYRGKQILVIKKKEDKKAE